MWFDRWGPETKQQAYPWKTPLSTCPHPLKKKATHIGLNVKGMLIVTALVELCMTLLFHEERHCIVIL